MITTMVRNIALLITLSILQSACATDQEIYQREADTFCNLHEKENWEGRNEFSALEYFDYLRTQIRSTVKSEAFLAVFDRLEKQGYDNFYESVKPEISKLIGKEWNCPAAKEFYAITWRKPKNKAITLTVTALANHTLQIGDSKYPPSDQEALMKGIESAASGQTYKILAKVPDGTSDEQLREYLHPFAQLGIKSLSIMYY